MKKIEAIIKPFKLDELEIVVKNACEKISLVRENRHLLQTLKATMEEMKQYRLMDEDSNLKKISSSNLDQKISEMDVLLRQMAPPDYDFKSKEYREQVFQNRACRRRDTQSDSYAPVSGCRRQ